MKNKYIRICLILAVLPIFLGSCRARFYTANRNPVPLFKRAGDVYLDGSTNLFNKIDFTAGFAPVKGLGTYVGYNRAFESSGSDSIETRRYTGDMLNLGLGYFLDQDQSEQFRFEIYGDIGLGSFKNRVTTNNAIHFFNGNYTRIGIMPNFGYVSTDDHFAFAYSIRMSNIRFHNASLSDSSFWNNDLQRYNSKSSYGMVEQAMTFRVGSEKVKFQLQLASYHGLNSDELINAVPRWNASIMIGLVITPNLYSY